MFERDVCLMGAAVSSAAVAAFAGASEVRAATYTVVAVTATPAPGTAGSFTALNAVSTGLADRVVFSGRSGTQQNGVWAGPASGVVLAALGGPGAPSPPGVTEPGAAFNVIDYPVANAAGGFAFTASIANVTSTTNAGLWVAASAGAPLTLAARKGDQAPGMPPGNVLRALGSGGGNSQGVSLNNAGAAAFLAGTSGVAAPQSMVLAGVPGSLTAAAITNAQAPGQAAGVQFAALDFPPQLNNAGALAFRATLLGPGIGFVSNEAIWNGAPGSPSLALRNGSDSPAGFPAGTVWNSLPPPSWNDAGQCAFAALTNGPAINQFNSSGVWFGLPASPALLSRQGDAAPGAGPGTQFGQFGDLRLNRHGVVASLAATQFGDTTPANGAGLWLMRAGGAPRLLIRLGAPAPGAGLATITSLNSGMTLNNRGQVAFLSDVSDGTRVLCVGSANLAGVATFDKIARTGEGFQVAAGDTRTILQIRHFLFESAFGMRTLNDAGELAFILDFTNGTSAVVLARTPLPCAGDANGDGMVDFLDLNQVLSQFGQTGPGLLGDVNGDGAVDFFDLNLILAAYGTGC